MLLMGPFDAIRRNSGSHAFATASDAHEASPEKKAHAAEKARQAFDGISPDIPEMSGIILA